MPRPASAREPFLAPAAVVLSIHAVLLLAVREPYLRSFDAPFGPLDAMRLPEAALAFVSVCALGWTFVRFRDDARAHVSTLLAVGAALWLTPFFLSGFVRFPDALWHLGASGFVNSVDAGALAGHAGLHYVAGFPAAFTLLAALTEAGPIGATARFVFPVLATTTFLVATYAVGRRLLGSAAAFAAVGLFLLGTTYVELHPSPRGFLAAVLPVVGLAALLGSRGVGFAAVLAAPLPFAHPLGGAALVVLAGAGLVWWAVRNPASPRRLGLVALAIVAAGVLAVAWLLVGPESHGGEFGRLLRRVFAPDPAVLLLLVAPVPFAVPEIGLFRVLLPTAAAAAAAIALASLVPRARRDGWRSALASPGGLVAIAATGFGALLLASVLAGGAGRDRALFFLLALLLLAVGSALARGLRAGVVGAGLVVAAALVALPTAAFAFESYATYPPAEAGVFAFAEELDLGGRQVDMLRFDLGYQLVATLSPGEWPSFVGPFANATALDENADVFVWRRSLSHQDGLAVGDPGAGSYDALRIHAESSPRWSRVYASGVAEVYVQASA